MDQPRRSASLGRENQAKGAWAGLTSAALFGISTPAAKVLLGSFPPVLLAGLLYLGAAAGLWIHRLLRPGTSEAPLTRGDLPILAAVTLTGGVLGPALMLLGLTRVSAVVGSLLLNLEAPFTVLLAVLVFREHVSRYVAVAIGLIVSGAMALRFEPGVAAAQSSGMVLLAAACLCWAIDNNLTQRLSLRDPFAIVRVKSLVAGLFNTGLGIAMLHTGFPQPPYLLGALLLGSLSYGASVVLDAYALRLLGAAREAAYFATAPFIGALGAWLLLKEPLRGIDILAMGIMATGVTVLLRERHSHAHFHAPLEHEHLHTHDEHHQHRHAPGDPGGQPHSHWHRHAPLVHDHPHLPDAHHRHPH